VIFIAGLCFGSFMNVLIYRIPRGIGTVKGRSFCPDCGHTLRWYDLFPVFSYIFLGGRCRYCKAAISLRYAAIELLNAFLWLAYAAKYMLYPMTMVGHFIFGSALICIIFIDAEHMLIFDRFNIAIAVGGVLIAADKFLCDNVLYYVYPSTVTITDRLIGAVCVSGLFFLIALISRGRAMGGGDIKLTAAAGLVLGWQSMLAVLVLASLAGTVGSLIQMAVKKLKTTKAVKSGKIEDKPKKPEPVVGDSSDSSGGSDDVGDAPIGHAVPFGPYLAGAMIVMSFLGTELVNIYLKLCGY
jgi:Type II secretory pathway, prepilin signal peptidase PulO and related peptidases